MPYLLQRPSSQRKRWNLLKVDRDASGKRLYKSFPHPSLDTINNLYEKGTQTFEQLDKQAVELRRRLSRADKGLPESVIFNQENLSLLGEFHEPASGTYWKEVYGRKKRIIDRRSSYYDLRRAIEAVGLLSLVAASEEELQGALEAHKWPDNKQRRVVSRLQPILKWLGRTDIKLEKARPEKRLVRHLTTTEFTVVYKHLESPEIKALCALAITSGMRLGELFAINKVEGDPRYIQVLWQVDKEGKLRETKTREDRKAYLLPGGQEALKAWCEIDEPTRLRLRGMNLASIVKAACVKAFPADPNKHCVFHDLRHSYAIELLSKGVPLSFVARSLGNSELVCEKHYTGKVLTDGFIEAIDSLIKKSNG